MPEGPIVVVNTTPIIGLSAIGHLWLLERIYGRVTIPTAVRDEVFAGGSDSPGAADLAKSWILVQEPSVPAHTALLADLDRGEAAAIALALELRADLVILDEQLARRYARRLGLAVTGTLGVLLRAKADHAIPLVRPLVDDLDQAGIWLAPPLIAECLRLAGET